MKTGTLLAIFFLVVVAVLHLLRLLFGVTIVIGGTPVPLWVSILSFSSFRNPCRDALARRQALSKAQTISCA